MAINHKGEMMDADSAIRQLDTELTNGGGPLKKKRKLVIDPDLRKTWINTFEPLKRQLIFSGLSMRQFILQNKKTIDAVIRAESSSNG
jgi:hypothetical protein